MTIDTDTERDWASPASGAGADEPQDRDVNSDLDNDTDTELDSRAGLDRSASEATFGGGATVYWAGDRGELDMDARQALHALVKWTFISPRNYPVEWKAFAANRAAIESRLNDLLLELVVDDRREVAYKRQASGDGTDRFPTLFKDNKWSREETILLVHLRSTFRAATRSGQARVFVDREDLLAHVELMRPKSDSAKSRGYTAADNAIEAVRATGLLDGKVGADRFEVDPAIETLLSVERLEELLSWITAAPADDTGTAADGMDGTDDEDGSTLL